MTFEHLRIGHAGAAYHTSNIKKRAAARTDCPGGFYKAPAMDSTHDSLQPLTVSWDPSCIPTVASVDIWLIHPGADAPRIHLYHNITNSLGTYDAEIMPRWWNAASSAMLTISVVESGVPIFLNPFSNQPIFTVTYEAPANGVTPAVADTTLLGSAGDGITDVGQGVMLSGAASTQSLSGGKIAAAVILPLLAAVALGYAYLRYSRAKGRAQRKQWTEAVDKRMSTISTDWKSMSAAGANAAIRHSMAVDNEKRDSSFSFGAIRPSSTFANEGGQAGVGARSLYTQDNGSAATMSQLRPGLRQSAFENRTSRISFATDTRPSGESRRTRRFDSTYEVPPMPTARAPSAYYGDEDYNGTPEVNSLSPRQANGALALTPEDIRSRIGSSPRGQNSFDEVLPALSMMRTDGSGNDEGSYVSPPAATHVKPVGKQPVSASTVSTYSLPSALPDAPDYYAAASPDQYVNAPASATLFTASPVSPNFPSSPPMSSPPTSFGGMMQPMMVPASVMSPDEMLRAYAERSTAAAAARRNSGGISTSSISAPMPYDHAPTPSSNRMSYLGNGVGFGATVATHSTGGSSRRSLMPAGPGVVSPSRGVYGISYDDEYHTNAQ